MWAFLNSWPILPGLAASLKLQIVIFHATNAAQQSVFCATVACIFLSCRSVAEPWWKIKGDTVDSAQMQR